MSFREKIAWLALATLVICYSAYFVAAEASPARTIPHFLLLFAAATVGQALLYAAGYAYLAARSPDEAKARKDERDLRVRGRAAAFAYFLLMVGMVVVGIVMPLGAAGVEIVNAALFTLVVVEAARHAATIHGYRRGLDG